MRDNEAPVSTSIKTFLSSRCKFIVYGRFPTLSSKENSVYSGPLDWFDGRKTCSRFCTADVCCWLFSGVDCLDLHTRTMCPNLPQRWHLAVLNWQTSATWSRRPQRKHGCFLSICLPLRWVCWNFLPLLLRPSNWKHIVVAVAAWSKYAYPLELLLLPVRWYTSSRSLNPSLTITVAAFGRH